MVSFYSNALGWKELGYFASPTSSEDQGLRKNPDAERWLYLEEIVEQAKCGNFQEMPNVVGIYNSAHTAVLKYVCSRVLGDAGTGGSIKMAIEELQNACPGDPNKVLHYCSTLRAWGSLSSVKVILDAYGAIQDFQDSNIIPVYLSSLLEEGEWGPICQEPSLAEFEDYRKLVIARYEEMRNIFGTEMVIVFERSLFSVKRIAQVILRRVSDDPFDIVSQPYLRRRFEASTGIDCSEFYREKRFQPLRAAKIVEEFLEDPNSEKLEDGVRYFFGYEIPD